MLVLEPYKIGCLPKTGNKKEIKKYHENLESKTQTQKPQTKMNDLQIINIENETVSARELHQFLEVKKDFTDWMKYQIKSYKFENKVDYSLLKISERNAHNKTSTSLLEC